VAENKAVFTLGQNYLVIWLFCRCTDHKSLKPIATAKYPLMQSNRHIRVFAIFVAFFALTLVSGLAYADGSPFSLSKPIWFGASEFQQAARDAREAKTRGLSELFYRSIKSAQSGDFAEAGAGFGRLRENAEQYGYRNYPDFSFELLNAAKTAKEKGETEELRFYVNHATALSPKDARVQLIAASFYEVVGYAKAAERLLQAAKLLPSQPVLFYTFVVNLLLTALIGITVALFTVLIVQVLRSGGKLHSALVGLLPRKSAGILAPIGMLLVLIVPLFFGVICAIAVWALLLSYSKKSCQWVAAISGCLAIAWGLSLPILSTIGYNVALQANRVVEDINNFSFSPEGEAFISRQLQHAPDDIVLLFVLGEIYQTKGMFKEAEGIYRLIEGRTQNARGLRQALDVNLGAIQYLAGNYTAARTSFEKSVESGNDSFEVYYNLAISHLAELDMAKHREFYAIAKDMDALRMSELEAQNGDARTPLMSGLPKTFYLSLLSKPVGRIDPNRAREHELLQARVSETLLVGSKPIALTIFGFVLLAFGIWARSCALRRKHREQGNVAHESGASFLWLALPAGRWCSGDRPILGVFGLGLCIGSLIFALEAPVSFFGELPVEVSYERGLLLITFLIFIVLSLASLFDSRASEMGATS
jgi:tetratricopeptide (TPR) repeat protein